MKQLEIPFRTARPRLVEYSDDDLQFLAITPPWELPKSFLMECRAKRIGCSLSELSHMRSYELARELADEVAILSLPDHDSIPAFRPDRELIDAIAKRETAERMKDFEEWQKEKRAAEVEASKKRRGK